MPRKGEPEEIYLEVGASAPNKATTEKTDVKKAFPCSKTVPIPEGVDIGRMIGKNGRNVKPLQNSQYGHVHIYADKRLVTVRAYTREDLERHFSRVNTLLSKMNR